MTSEDRSRARSNTKGTKRVRSGARADSRFTTKTTRGDERKTDRSRGTSGGSRAGRTDHSRAGRSAGSSAPKSLGGEQVEGRHAVRELLAAGRRRVKEVWISEDAEVARLLDEIADLALSHRVPLRRVGEARLKATAKSDATQGVVAFANALDETDLDDLLRPRRATNPFLVVIDGVTDPHDLGALLRSAEAAGATGIVLGRHRAVHVTATVTKAAAGAVERLAIAVVPGIPAALTTLSKAGVWTVGVDSASERSIYSFELTAEPVALVLGSEGRGLSRLALQRCDAVVKIPQQEAGASLNISAVGTVACFEVARRRASAKAH